jgi:cohesin loading factor subunit SCC2
LTSDPTQPCLHPTLVRKITKYISLVTRASKRGGRAKPRDPIATTPRAVGRLSDVEPTILTRILKLLERSVRAGEELDPFKLDEIHTVTISMAEENMSPTKGGKKGKAKASAEAPRSTPLDDDIKEPSEEELSSLTHSLAIACDSILAAEACLALLCGDRLAKHLYSEDLISACLSTIKNQLTRVLYPFIEAAPGIPMSAILYHLVQSGAGTAMKAHRQQISNIFQALSAALPRIDAMVYADSVAMSDSLVIQAVYIAIGPFFVVEGQPDIAGKGKKENVVVGTLGSSAMRGLRLGALSLIRSVRVIRDFFLLLSRRLTSYRFLPTMTANVLGLSRRFFRPLPDSLTASRKPANFGSSLLNGSLFVDNLSSSILMPVFETVDQFELSLRSFCSWCRIRRTMFAFRHNISAI